MKKGLQVDAHSSYQIYVLIILLQCSFSSQPADKTYTNAAEQDSTGSGNGCNTKRHIVVGLENTSFDQNTAGIKICVFIRNAGVNVVAGYDCRVDLAHRQGYRAKIGIIETIELRRQAFDRGRPERNTASPDTLEKFDCKVGKFGDRSI